jgi:hypothetical protein
MTVMGATRRPSALAREKLLAFSRRELDDIDIQRLKAVAY